MTTATLFLRNARGSGAVQMLVLVGGLALAGIAGVKVLAGAINDTTACTGAAIQSLTGGPCRGGRGARGVDVGLPAAFGAAPIPSGGSAPTPAGGSTGRNQGSGAPGAAAPRGSGAGTNEAPDDREKARLTDPPSAAPNADDPKGGHDSNKRPSNRGKHQKGDERRKRDQGGEKSDERNRQPGKKRAGEGRSDGTSKRRRQREEKKERERQRNERRKDDRKGEGEAPRDERSDDGKDERGGDNSAR